MSCYKKYYESPFSFGQNSTAILSFMCTQMDGQIGDSHIPSKFCLRGIINKFGPEV